jgi:hypothetical protein
MLLCALLAGCSPVITPVSPEIASVAPGVPLAEQPALRHEIAKLVEVQLESGKLYSLPLEDARITQITRKSRGVERPAYCVYAVMRDLIGFPNPRTWLIENSVLKSGNAYLSVDSGTYGCPDKDVAEPFPELIAAREARRAGGPATIRAGGPATVNAGEPPKAPPVTSHTPVTISTPTDGRAGQ